MGDLRRPVTAAQIRARPEWQATYPGAEIVYEQDADEGQGTGFDNLDKGASAWTYYHAMATWEQVVDAYAERLSVLGWHRTDAGGPYWTHQVWASPVRPGESVAVTHRPSRYGEPGWGKGREGTVFSVFHRVDPGPVQGTPDA